MSTADSPAAHLPVFKVIPFFKSSSITATVAFYLDNLRFKGASVYPTPTGESNSPPPTFCSLVAGPQAAVNIYFLTSASPSEAMIAFKDTESLEHYYGTLKSAGKVNIVEALEDKEWGYRQFGIQDPDGNKLIFFSHLSDSKA